MSQKLHTTAVAAIGELQLLTQVQELQDISLEQLEQAQCNRSGLLITCYYSVKFELRDKVRENNLKAIALKDTKH